MLIGIVTTQVLQSTSSSGNCEIIPSLLKRHANVNALARFSSDDSKKPPSITPLYLASRYVFPECVKTLINACADVNRQTCDGYTAYLTAAENGQFETLKMLVEAGADTSVRTVFDEGALDLAFKDGRVNYTFIRYIIDHTKDRSALFHTPQGKKELRRHFFKFFSYGENSSDDSPLTFKNVS